MKKLIQLEESIQFLCSFLLFLNTDYRWWIFFAWLLAPDLGIIGYLAGPKLGAITYNITHHKGIALMVLISGWNFDLPWLAATGIILFAHSSMDRVFGYGLKYTDNFHHTHLGWIGKHKTE